MPEITGAAPAAPEPSTRDQHYLIAVALNDQGAASRADRLAALTRLAGRDIPAFAALTKDEAGRIITELGAS